MDTSKTQVKVLYAARTLVDSVAVQFEWGSGGKIFEYCVESINKELFVVFILRMLRVLGFALF